MSGREHALVLGASMAGLCAARALSKHYRRVTLVDRDRLPEEASLESRKGVPQGNHGHVLLAAGLRALGAYFPQLAQELIAAGAATGDIAEEFLFYQHGAWKLRTPIGLKGLSMSRPLLESKVYKQLRASSKVGFVEEHDILEPVCELGRRRVTGARVRDRARGDESSIDADLVVDATGRGSLSPKWLRAWGFDEVPETHVKCGVGYATGYFERRRGDCAGPLGALVVGTPPLSKRGGGLFAAEGDRWVVTLGGWLRDHPPTELDGFKAFARSLPQPHVYDVIKEREPLLPLARYRFDSSRHRHYERLARFPQGYLVIGDAICSFNPLYGQGMTVAALEAQALDRCLSRGDESLARRFFEKALPIVRGAWTIAVGEDLRFPEVEGARPFGFALISRYMSAVHRAAARDPVVQRRFLEVAGLLTEPTAIMDPRIVWRVARGGVGTAPPPPSSCDQAAYRSRVGTAS